MTIKLPAELDSFLQSEDSGDARGDLEEIRRWVSRDNPAATRRWLDKARAKFRRSCGSL